MGFKLFQEVIDHSQAKGAVYTVHTNLALRADDESRQYRASIARISKETRLPRRTVEYGLQGLRGLQHIASTRKGSKRGISAFTLLPIQPAIIADLQPAAIAGSSTHNPQPLRIVGQTTRNGCVQLNKKEKQLRNTPADAGESASQTSESLPAPTREKVFSSPISGEEKKSPPPPPLRIVRRQAQPGPWFEALCAMWPNRARVDRDTAAREARKREADGPRILAAAKELAKSDNWTKEGGTYVPTLSKFIAGGIWRSVPVLLTVQDAQRDFEGALKDISAEHWKHSQAQALRARFETVHGTGDFDRCLTLLCEAKRLAAMRLAL